MFQERSKPESAVNHSTVMRHLENGGTNTVNLRPPNPLSMASFSKPYTGLAAAHPFLSFARATMGAMTGYCLVFCVIHSGRRGAENLWSRTGAP